MYSPKIAEDLIPGLYRLSKDRGRPMTKIVDEILREKFAYYRAAAGEADPGSSGSEAA